MKLNKETILNLITEHNQDDIKKANELVASDKYYRPTYHIAPPNGLLNDPNGLVYVDGEHYIHYQWSPLQPYHGMKHWRLVKTKDFVNYDDLGVSIIPTEEFERTGAFSGSAFKEKDGVKIYYTGNIEENGEMIEEVQIKADFIDEKIVNKRVVVEHDKNLFTPHVRDPKIFEYENNKYMIFGAQCKADMLGGLVFYKTDDMEKYTFDRILKPSLDQTYGYMWECPNLDYLEGKMLFMQSSEGWFNEENPYELNSSRNVVYTQIDKLDFENNKLNEKSILKTMDFGHDFYAPQTYWVDKKLLMIGWLGAVDVQYPTDEYSWHSMLTIPRELSWSKEILVQKPYSEFKKNVLTKTTKEAFKELSVNKAIHLEFDLSDNLDIKILNEKNEFIEIKFTDKEIILDRTNQTAKVDWNFETPRKALRKFKNQKVEIFIDSSSIEIFADNYETIFTSRFFVKNFNKIQLNKEHEMLLSDIKEMKLK
ncbi:glycoside hydrolase family 32 protein [Mesoplasma coleopterae]|uniref:beta-fructofuranosidase n=1 Tax=Mesoplasma coleopterae TaxID=324078 RepID=A0A2K8P4J0_9MOLU|nr:glycoside hydrolase family 32 protein [Mesoplasma coleopterae]ATZ21060.1 sucrose-6-phosphate hydrolase [Mesoplasma coleopterae]AVN62541.1 hypothetical protein CG001_02790 [Mesoplasma coleopterae]